MIRGHSWKILILAALYLTMIAKDSSMYIHYKNHQESVICVGGSLVGLLFR